MKKIILTLLTLAIVLHSFGQLPVELKKEKLTVSFNKNIELLGFAYFLAFEGQNSETKTLTINGKEVLEKDWQNYGYHVYQQYKHFASSKNLIKASAITEHLWLSDIIPLLLQTTDFPNAALPPNIDESFFIDFSAEKNPAIARQQASLFLTACNDFYKEVNFDQYLRNSSVCYREAEKQLIENLPAADFILQAEKLYRKSFDSYSLIPSLTIPKGMGFGPRYTTNGFTKVFNVFGAVDVQVFLNTEKPNMGFGNRDKLRELSTHEFGHSFVNPEFFKLSKDLYQPQASLFTPLRAAMEEQGYTTWATCLVEHFVRAGEVVIAEMMGNTSSAEKLKQEYIAERKFVYLPLMIEELHHYQSDPQDTYLAMMTRVLQKLNLEQKPVVREETFATNPRDAKFHTEDITQFWKLFDQSQSNPSAEILQTEYIDKGSIGLKGFVHTRIESGKHLSKVVKSQLSYYAYVRPYTLAIADKKELFYQSFEKLKQLYPPAVFPDVYFVIGANSSGGTTFDQGLIIGAEKFGKPNDTHKPPVDIDNVHQIVTHESIHFQQQYPNDFSLLAQSIREGAADFVMELVTKSGIESTEMYTYGYAHRNELWEEFKSKMHQNDWTNWLYSLKDKSRPRDLGYWMGYTICKSYYNNSADKAQAIHEILNIQDFKKFFEKSKFPGE